MIDLRLGDCFEIIPKLKEKFRLVLCDLPYGITACDWDTKIDLVKFWEVVKPILTEDGSVVMFGSQPFTSELVMSNRKMFKYCLVWVKCRPTGQLLIKKRPMRKHEDIIIFQNKMWHNMVMGIGKPYKQPNAGKQNNITGDGKRFTHISSGERYPVSVLYYPNKFKALVPTQKPVPLLEYLIKTYSNEEDWVLDPTMGSGSCGVACKNTNRNFVGIEKDLTYFNIAKDRLAL